MVIADKTLRHLIPHWLAAERAMLAYISIFALCNALALYLYYGFYDPEFKPEGWEERQRKVEEERKMEEENPKVY